MIFIMALAEVSYYLANLYVLHSVVCFLFLLCCPYDAKQVLSISLLKCIFVCLFACLFKILMSLTRLLY